MIAALRLAVSRGPGGLSPPRGLAHAVAAGQGRRPENRLRPAAPEPILTGMMTKTIVAGFGPAVVAGCHVGWAPDLVTRPRRGRTVLAVQSAPGV
jgi:hypothetical protein